MEQFARAFLLPTIMGVPFDNLSKALIVLNLQVEFEPQVAQLKYEAVNVPWYYRYSSRAEVFDLLHPTRGQSWRLLS